MSIERALPFNVVEMNLPIPELVDVNTIERAKGYELPGTSIVRVTVKHGDLEAVGHGEAQSMQFAVAKARSEAIERYTLFATNRLGMKSDSSNGWACHVNEAQAVEAAVFEIIEREVARKTWESGGPYYLIPRALWPTAVKLWDSREAHEYSDLKLLLNIAEEGCAISALLFNKSGNFVSGHASASNLEHAVLSATQECLRAAHMALRFEYISEVFRLHQPASKQNSNRFEPGVHALAYAYSEKMPTFVEYKKITETQCLTTWRNHQDVSLRHLAEADTRLFHVGDRVVAHAYCKGFRKMLWGRDLDAEIKQNKHPHIVG